jgi:hypothetical protein
MPKGKSSKGQRSQGARYLSSSRIFQPKTKKKKEHERLEKSSGSKLETYQDVHSERRLLTVFLKKTAVRQTEAAKDT